MNRRLPLPMAVLATSLALLGCAEASPPAVNSPSDPLAPRGRLPPEEIQRVARGSFNAYRRCYDDGLVRNPRLEGRVTVRFVIERDGSVSQARSEGSNMPDPAVVDCVIAEFEKLRFPPPSNGVVTVTYPIMFAPGSQETSPAPATSAPPPAARTQAPEAGAPLVPGVVRLHVDSPVPAELVEHLGVRDTKYRTHSISWTQEFRRICVTPCDAVIDARHGHSFTLTSPAFPESEHFYLSDRTGDLRISLAPGNETRLTAASWMTALGGLGTLFGTIALPLSFVSNESPGFKAMSAGILAGSVAVLAGGIVLLVRSRTHLRFEPAVQARTPSLWMGGF